MPHPDGKRPVILFADLLGTCGSGEAGWGPTQGDSVFLHEVGRRLREYVPTAAYSTRHEQSHFIREVAGHRLIGLRFAAEIWRQQPRAIIYVYPITLAALVRARLLKAAGRGARTIVIGLTTNPGERWVRVLGRLFWPDLVLVTPQAEKEHLAALGARVGHLPAGVDTERFRPVSPDEKVKLRDKWGLPQEQAVLLHVGHLVGPRNVQILATLARRPNTTAVVLASHVRDRDSERLEEQLRRSGVVVLMGYQPHVEELYQAADCYVFPAHAWGGGIDMPLSVLEAMASGLPVVSSFFGALPEHFPNAAGIRFAANDADFPRAIDDMLRLRPPTRQLVMPYSWDAIAERLLHLL